MPQTGAEKLIGETIQKIRKSKGITLSELAERADMSKSYLSNIERGLNQNPSIHVIEKIACVLNVDLNTLLGITADPPSQMEEDLLNFVNELKQSGIDKEQLDQYKTVFEFIKWKKHQKDETSG